VHLHAGHFVHALEYFFLVDGVGPVLLLGSGDLVESVTVLSCVEEQAYIMIDDPNHNIWAGQSQCISGGPVKCKFNRDSFLNNELTLTTSSQ
jgi:hypothetical protein